MKTDLAALSCSLLLLTTHIFCADPFVGEADAMGQNQQTNPVTVLSSDEFKWLAQAHFGCPRKSSMPEKSEQWSGFSEEECMVLAATARPPKQSKVISTGFAVPSAEFIIAPGAQRFYSLIPSQPSPVLISGNDRESVDVVFGYLIRAKTYHDLQEAAEEAKKKNVLLATKMVERLCDVMVPVELEHYIAHVVPCLHENSFMCTQHQNKVCEALKQAADQAEATHEAMISMPYISEVITYAAE